ncbi:sigma 54-interacting transcriptional regulator [uncultured Thiohalocapsa sp.]|uniref:sigma 54-interacting transcriptional regulator n=1 Tax=uncultured Thiohalocapsa sp. TaxID=768990 RepID=UPI0025FB94DB|nr:sigma-54 dependent transcriptional regulator [uncultured Thiohalocapsa sp.]
MRDRSLLLLPTAGGADRLEAVTGACTALGYAVSISSLESLSASPPAAPLLVLAGTPDTALAERLHALCRPRGIPALAVLVGGHPGWGDRLAELCCDCVRWPCEQPELDFRLARLCRQLPEPAADALDPALAGLLAELNLIGRAPAFNRAMAVLGRMLPCAAPVLIEGETGTGKELAARALHYLGPRAGGPFVAVNCGALPDQLLENELFGHARGAYTDAKTASAGAIGDAAGGTLFLDEIETLSPKAQAALLRFLQEHEYRPLGSSRTLRSDARVVAASNADLRRLSTGVGFRADLYFRLDVLALRLPPLRERVTDIPLLARHFIHRFCAEYGLPARELAPAALPVLAAHPWPGNVRELENLIHRSVLLADGALVFPQPAAGEAMPSVSAAPTQEPFAVAKARAIEAFERSYLTDLLQATGGNVSEAARRADKERRALGKLLKKHAIDAGPARS